jgi:hypothetical protein
VSQIVGSAKMGFRGSRVQIPPSRSSPHSLSAGFPVTPSFFPSLPYCSVILYWAADAPTAGQLALVASDTLTLNV